MDLDAHVLASDPSNDPTPEIREALLALAADAEAAVAERPRRRRFAVVGGAVGAVLVGAGVANASGVPLPGLSNSHPHTACTVTVGPVVTPTGRTQISITKDQRGISVLAHLVRDRGEGLQPSAGLASRHELQDVVQRLAAQTPAARTAKAAHPGSACLQR